MLLNFTEGEITLLNTIADIQIESYHRILRGSFTKDQIELLKAYQASLEDIKKEANWKLKQYEELKKQPLYLGIIEDKELSMMRHVLYHIEFDGKEETSISYLSDIQALWKKFFQIEAEREPKLVLTSLLNHNGEEQNIIRVPKRRLVPTKK